MCCVAPNWRQYFTPIDHIIGGWLRGGETQRRESVVTSLWLRNYDHDAASVCVAAYSGVFIDWMWAIGPQIKEPAASWPHTDQLRGI